MFYAQVQSKAQVGFYVPLILPIARQSVVKEEFCPLRRKGLTQACRVTVGRCWVHASGIKCVDGLWNYVSDGVLGILGVSQICSEEFSPESELVLAPRLQEIVGDAVLREPCDEGIAIEIVRSSQRRKRLTCVGPIQGGRKSSQRSHRVDEARHIVFVNTRH